MTTKHECGNCEGIQPESCLFNPARERDPSPYCSIYISRKQAEEIWRLLHQQPEKKWTPHRKALLRGLRNNARNKHYLEKP